MAPTKAAGAEFTMRTRNRGFLLRFPVVRQDRWAAPVSPTEEKPAAPARVAAAPAKDYGLAHNIREGPIRRAHTSATAHAASRLRPLLIVRTQSRKGTNSALFHSARYQRLSRSGACIAYRSGTAPQVPCWEKCERSLLSLPFSFLERGQDKAWI